MNKIDVIKALVEKEAENGELWYLLGTEYMEQSNLSEALFAFSQALRYSKGDMKDQILLIISKLAVTETLVEEQEQEEQSNVLPFSVIRGSGNADESISERKKITFGDVGGLETLKESITMKIIKPFTNPGLFDRFKKKAGGGILLYGPPGCGKTYIARATAGECNARFIPVHISDILDPYMGVSESNVRALFESARASRPSILFFDEMDAIGYNRSKASSSLTRTIVDQFLAEIDGIDSNTDKMLIIGASNMPWDIDMAFKRPGRFDRMVFVPPPDLLARMEIFRLKLMDKPIEDIDYKALALKTELYSGADIENVVESATEYVIDEIMKTDYERPIRMSDLHKAIENTKPSTIEWMKTIKNYVKYANQGGTYNDVEEFLKKYKL